MNMKILIIIIFLIIILAITIPYIWSYFREHQIPTYTPTVQTETRILRNLTYAKHVEIVVVVDNYQFRNDLMTAWGISIYLVVDGFKILFDTGPSEQILEYNAAKLGIDLTDIDAVVISHVHGDHIGGLSFATALSNKNVTVYVPLEVYPTARSLLPNMNIAIVNETMKIAPHAYVVGPLYGPPQEMFLAISTRKGLIIVTGCSHPGIVNMVKKAMEDLNQSVYMVIGGFHLAGAYSGRVRSIADELVGLGVKKIYPLHCSGDCIRNYLKNTYPDVYGDGGVGLKVIIES